MLFHKSFHHGEEMFLYYPGTQQRTPFKRSALFVLMDEVNEQTVTELLEEKGLRTLALDEEIVLAFPIPPQGGWREMNHEAFRRFYDGVTKPDDDPLAVNHFGIPTFEAMSSTWHPMNDVRYVIGLGGGADYALRLGAEKPEWLAGIWAVGGALDAQLLPVAPMPVWLSGSNEATVRRFCEANETDAQEGSVHFCRRNPSQRVVLEDTALDEAAFRHVWNAFFRQLRRVNTCVHGDVTDRMGDPRALFSCFIEDDRLDGTPHTWFVHMPTNVRQDERLPLVLFFHGGSDNPAEAAEMVRLHELGETERFITVYPWGTNRCSWNSGMEPDQADDVAFCAALIRHMLRCYPVDAQRVYLSGFSNGAAHAQTVALCHPELVAAIFHIDSNWPGKYGGYGDLDWREVIPFARGMERKEVFDYRIPVWYTYGSRERSYPVWRGSTQQHQYDFWKLYNHVPIRPTPAEGEESQTGCGVPGDVQETLHPSQRYPHHWYDVQRFMDASGQNLYNYVVMHDKGHEVAERDAELGWRFVRSFRRLPDGSLVRTEESKA